MTKKKNLGTSYDINHASIIPKHNNPNQEEVPLGTLNKGSFWIGTGTITDSKLLDKSSVETIRINTREHAWKSLKASLETHTLKLVDQKELIEELERFTTPYIMIRNNKELYVIANRFNQYTSWCYRHGIEPLKAKFLKDIDVLKSLTPEKHEVIYIDKPRDERIEHYYFTEWLPKLKEKVEEALWLELALSARPFLDYLQQIRKAIDEYQEL